MTTPQSEEETKGTAFLFICGGIALMVLGAAVWMALKGGLMAPETVAGDGSPGETWVKLGRSGVLDVSYRVEGVSGDTAAVVRRSECGGNQCLNAIAQAKALMSDSTAVPVRFETEVEVDCSAEQFREGEMRIYDEDDALVTSGMSPVSEEAGWVAFEKFPQSSLEYHGMMKKVCEKEVWSKEES